MKTMDALSKLRRNAAFAPGALDRGKAKLMAEIESQTAPLPRPTVVPQLPYHDVRAALEFLERAFGFRELTSSRVEDEHGVVGHAMVAFGDGLIGLGQHGGHGTSSPKSLGGESEYVSVYVPDVDAHYRRALAAGARIANGLRDQFWGDRTYEALDLEGHRWRFHQRVREVPRAEWKWSPSDD
ncbi:MAG TPA: VOC family protein [Myxococcota bacterium]|nr:VOC family protein [Myxococcota bacterium]